MENRAIHNSLLESTCSVECTAFESRYSGWYISSITDGAGRVTTINRNEDNYISEIYAPGETEPIRFYYDGFKLWMINNPYSGSTEFAYDENGMMYEMLDTQTWKLLYLDKQADGSAS